MHTTRTANKYLTLTRDPDQFFLNGENGPSNHQKEEQEDVWVYMEKDVEFFVDDEGHRTLINERNG